MQKLEVFSFSQNALYLKHRPREDFLATDRRTRTFVVADGVGMKEGIEYDGRYPRASGSYRLSRAFSRAFVDYFKRQPVAALQKGFVAGNAAARRVNRSRSKYNAFRTHKVPYAATAAMARLRGNVLEWAHICDAGVAVIDSQGKLKLRKDDCGHHFPWPRDANRYDPLTWSFFARTLVRNAVGRDGRLMGYGVITGEPEAVRYLEQGQYRLLSKDIVLLYSDGFAPYLSLLGFRKALASAESKRGFQAAVEQIINRKTVRLRNALRRHALSPQDSVDATEDKLRKILGRRFKEVEWAREKSLIVVKAS